MKIYQSLFVEVVWIIFCVVQGNVVLSDDGSSRFETTFAPTVSEDTESKVSSCSSSADEECKTHVAERTTEDPNAYPQITIAGYMVKEPNSKAIQASIIAEINKRIEAGNVSMIHLEGLMSALREEMQPQPDFLAQMKEETVLLYAHRPRPTLVAIDDDMAQLYFPLRPNLENRNMTNARLFYIFNPPRDVRILKVKLYWYKDQEKGASNSTDDRLFLLDERTVEVTKRRGKVENFNVFTLVLLRYLKGDKGLTLLLRAYDINGRKLHLQWRSGSHKKRPFIAVNARKRPKRRRPRIKRDDEALCTYTNDGHECCRYPYPMDLEGGIDFNWIIPPQTYDMGKCIGSCSEDMSPSDDKFNELEEYPENQCVPSVISSSPIIYYDPFDEVMREKTSLSLVVEECDCV